MIQIVLAELTVNELLHMRERHLWDSWRVGDIAREYTDNVVRISVPITLQEVRSQIAFYAGLSERTVRFYEALARFFPPGYCYRCAVIQENGSGKYVGGTLLKPHQTLKNAYICDSCGEVSVDVRESYAELAIRHFAIAAKERYQDRWQEVLEYCMNNGVPRGVDDCERHFSANPSPEKEGVLIHSSPDTQVYSTGIGSALHNTIVFAKRFVQLYPMPSEKRERIMSALVEIEKVAAEVLTADRVVR